MEIHELNTFSGTLGTDDFFATDNGNDTRKVSAESMLGPLNARIDNIIAGDPAPSEAEIVDARLGANGVVYPSLGDAIRSQVENIESDLRNYSGIENEKTLTIITGQYVTGSGTIASQSSFSRTSAFAIYKNAPIVVTATGYLTGVSMIALCDENEENIVSAVRSIDSSEHTYTYTPEKDGYAIVSFNHTHAYNISYGTDLSAPYQKNEIDTINSQIGYPNDTFSLIENGYIDRNGTKQPQSSFNIYGYVTLSKGDSIVATVRGANTAVAVIFASNENHNDFTPVVMSTDSSARQYTYTATKSIIIGLCSHIDTTPVYTVNRVPIYEALSGIEKESSLLAPILGFGSITCIGDSLTWSQVFVSSTDSRQAYNPYPNVIEHITGVPTSYIARAGASTSGLWSTDESSIVNKNGQLTIIYLGTNEGLTDTMDSDMSGSDYTTWSNTNTGCYGKFIAKSLAVNSRVVLVKVHSSSGDVAVTNTVIEKMGQRFNVPVLENTNLPGGMYHNWPNGQGSNGTHYNDFGYAQFAKRIVDDINNLPNEMLANMIPV